MTTISNTPRPSARLYKWIIITILLAQAILLTFRLFDQSMWTDEMYTYRIVVSPSISEALTQIGLTETRPPLHYLALWVWTRIVGQSEWGMRFFSIALMLLATALIYRVAKQFGSDRAAVWATLLTATAPTLILHGRIIRGYGMAVPLILLSISVFWQTLRDPSFKLKLIYLFVSIVLLLTDYLTAPLIGAQALYLLIHLIKLRQIAMPTYLRKLWFQWIAIGVSLLIVGGAMLLMFRGQVSSSILADRPRFDLSASLLSHLPQRIPLMAATPAFMLYSFSVGESLFPWQPLAVPATLAILFLGTIGLCRMWRAQRRSALLMLFVIFIPVAFSSAVVFGLLLGSSMIVVSAARNLFLGPLLFIPIGFAIDTLAQRRVVVALIGIVIAARGFSLLNQFTGQDFLNPVYGVPVRELATQVERNVQSGDVVIFEEPLPFDLYFRPIDQHTPLFTIGAYHLGRALPEDLAPGSPAFLGQNQPFTQAIASDRLLAYLTANLPARIWLVVFQHESDPTNVETQIGEPLAAAGLYRFESRSGYAPQDQFYAQLRSQVRSRSAIPYKAEIVLYERVAK